MQPKFKWPQDLAKEVTDLWQQFENALKDKQISLPDDPKIESILKRVFCFSPFVFRTCLQHPQMIDMLVKSNDLFNRYHENEYSLRLNQMIKAIDGSDPDLFLQELMKGLRRVRQYEYLRIAIRDLEGIADLEEIMRDLTLFAQTCIDSTLTALFNICVQKYGKPVNAQGQPVYLVVVGMGKLGGYELNFSSDVDLIFAYEENGQTQGTDKSVTNEEFFVSLSRLLLKVIGESVEHGLLFRTDMRLRPYGESGPLAMTFDAMEDYYQLQGREWERYAWIKARVVAGDRQKGKELLKILNPFIYRRYLDYNVFDSIRDMKQKIAAEVNRKGMHDNIKLGPGGIREIEFFGQVFQLIRGGIIPDLQKRGIQTVLDKLVSENIVPEDVSNQLNQAYVFLRITENRLQEYNDQQTHALPTDASRRLKLALSMGFDQWDSFYEELKRHRRIVQAQFNQLLHSSDSETENGPGKDGQQVFADIWLNMSDKPYVLTLLANTGFDNPAEIFNIFEFFKDHNHTRSLGLEGRKRLDLLIPRIMARTSHRKEPMIILQRLIELLISIERRTCYLSLLTENPSTLDHLIRLCTASPWIVNLLARYPILLDELLDPRTLYAPPLKEDMVKELDHRMAKIDPNDFEYQIEALRVFKQATVLRVAAADVTHALPLKKTSDRLTWIAETVVAKSLELAREHLVEKHGQPTCEINQRRYNRGFAVIAYGKLGGIELGYKSDLDLVFLHSGIPGEQTQGQNSIDNSVFFARLGQRLIHILTVHSSVGVLYEIDMRLRPSGSSGILVSHIDAFAEYQQNSAWTWEHQALVRARAICGNPEFIACFEDLRKEILTAKRDEQTLRQDVAQMREKLRQANLSMAQGFDIKHGIGGIVDIEFLVQYLVLQHAHEHESLAKWTDNVRILETLAKTGILTQETASFLTHTYLNYRSKVHRLNLAEKPAVVTEEVFDDLPHKVMAIWSKFLKV